MAKKIKQTELQAVRSKLRWGVAGIFFLLLLTIVFDVPQYANNVITGVNNATNIGIPAIPEKEFKLGLDLQGGAQLVYQADVAEIDTLERDAAVEGVRDVIERRVNGLGVGEAVIQTAKVGNDYRINVELPGVTDINEAIEMIGETPILEFKVENNEPPRELTEEEIAVMKDHNASSKASLEAVRQRIIDGESFEALVAEASLDQASKANGGDIGFITERMAPDYYTWAADAEEGDLSPVIELPGGYGLAMLKGKQPGQLEVESSHILICYEGASGCNSVYSEEEALALAQKVFDEANASNFAELAEKYSTDTFTKEDGGSFGYIASDMGLPAAYEDAIFNAEVGQILGPVKTELGYHIIYKTDERTDPEYNIAHIFAPKLTESDLLPAQQAWLATGLSGAQLERAEVVTDQQTGQIQVSLQFDREGSELFKQLTEEHLGEPIAIFLDSEMLSNPVVQSIIPNGQAVITSNFNIKSAQLLAQRLNAGALPVPVELISQQGIGASLGQASLQDSLQAGMIALMIVGLFMILYYRIPGVLSVIALGLYISLTLGVFKFIGVTLSLAGIAGFILSIGMAVDANVLIYERLKEELQRGQTLKQASEQAFFRAWPSIRDGNISTLITCFLLMWFGSSFVQGFALTLGIGVVVSMFSAITVSRVLLRFLVPWFENRVAYFFLGGKK